MAASKQKSSTGKLVRILAAVFVGTAIGMFTFAVSYAEVPSYFGSDPATCTNCHVMQPQYNAWRAGGHAKVATCNDCHLPHGSVVEKYMVKAEDGVLHGSKFTFGNYPVNINIRDSSLATTNETCLYCHSEMTEQLFITMGTDQTERTCTRCHSGIGHRD
ncbi:MAG: cytochrome c nitrite reductase small subunit [Micrococcales bacterium]|nr:cytochrome c nitrite reductase small subunit [Micrococcales bacterium]